MNKFLCTALLSAFAAPTFAGDVAVSISVGQPGFFGQIDIGGAPRPPVIYAQPVVAVRPPEYVAVEPVYLHVPPGYEKHWSRHCAQYNACGRPVYFVQHDWYNNEYVPRYQREHREREIAHGREVARDHWRHEENERHEEHERHDHDHDRDHDDHGHDRDHRDR